MAWRTTLLLPLALPIVLVGACADDESTTSGLSGGSATATVGESSSSSSSSSGASSSSSDSGSDGSTSGSGTTTDEPTTGDPGTTTDATTGPGTTDATTTTTSGSTSGSTGGGVCGNGALDPGEQCDGQNLGGYTCASLGYGGGTLTCDPVMCILDTSMCEMGGSTGGTSG